MGMGPDEFLVLQKRPLKTPQHHIGEAVELAAGVAEIGNLASQGIGHIDQTARLHVQHVLHAAVRRAVQNGQAALFQIIEAAFRQSVENKVAAPRMRLPLRQMQSFLPAFVHGRQSGSMDG